MSRQAKSQVAIATASALENYFSTTVELASDWVEDPLPLADFMAEHMGIPLWPVQQEDLEAFLGSTTADAKRLFSQDPPGEHNCGVLAWGKGSGKDLLSSGALAWFVHVLLCMRNPQEFLGLEQTEAIDLALASPTLRQTRRITFTKLRNRLKNWDWLHRRCAELGIRNPDRYLKRATEAADFVELPHKIRIHNLPLIATSTEGFNLLAFILSEFAGMESEVGAETATEVLSAFISSGKTRYKRAWKGFLASFPRSSNDPQEKIIEQHEAGEFPELYVVRRATWEVHPGRKFEDFESDFRRNPEDSWAKYGAKPRAATDNYFRSPELIVRHSSGGDRKLLQKYFSHLNPAQLDWLANRVPDPIAARDFVEDVLLDEWGFPRLHDWFRGKEATDYYAHIDIGLSRDSTGMAIGHLEQTEAGQLPVLDLVFRWKATHFAQFGDIRRHDWRGGDPYTERVDAAEIDLHTVTDFTIALQRLRGFNFEMVSCDGFNSAQLMQTLLQADIPVSLHVVNKADYDEFKGLIYSRQIQYRCDRILFHELNKLEIRGQKVEAPRTRAGAGDKGTDSHKDLADAAARVAARLCQMVASTEDFVVLPEVGEDAGEDAIATPKGKIESIEPPVFSEIQQQLFDEFLS